MANDTSRVADYHCVRFDRFGDDRTGSDDRAPAYPCAGKDDDSAADPYVVADLDALDRVYPCSRIRMLESRNA